ncbi:MAG: ATP-binding cassette domain-containing protein [Hyphomicrobiaceae bacterium]
MLELDAVSAGYKKGFQALFDVSMTVNAGEAVAVIGANGAGKTTLLRVISGLLPATRGAMRLGGPRSAGNASAQIIRPALLMCRKVALCFHAQRSEENLKMGAFIPSARAHYAERLDYVYGLFPRLKERRGQLAGTMSGARAADVRYRARADEPAETHSSRRAFDGVGAGDRAAGVRSRQADRDHTRC